MSCAARGSREKRRNFLFIVHDHVRTGRTGLTHTHGPTQKRQHKAVLAQPAASSQPQSSDVTHATHSAAATQTHRQTRIHACFTITLSIRVDVVWMLLELTRCRWQQHVVSLGNSTPASRISPPAPPPSPPPLRMSHSHTPECLTHTRQNVSLTHANGKCQNVGSVSASTEGTATPSTHTHTRAPRAHTCSTTLTRDTSSGPCRPCRRAR